jgi:HEPN domain-containing protein
MERFFMPNRDPRVLTLCADWLKRANEDFGLARHLLDEESVYLHAIAFHSQQAAGKYLKALLVFHQQEFPKTHDITELLDILSININAFMILNMLCSLPFVVYIAMLILLLQTG